MPQKRLITFQDYSCMGRCSLTVAIPTISAAGIECVGVPTTVLSNHTQFKSWKYTDLADQILPSLDEWKDYNHHFDMIYTGYLATNQIPLICKAIMRLKDSPEVKVVVDPAFADSGKLYPGFDYRQTEGMRVLMTYADIICPNLTEACLLTGEAYPDDYDELFIVRLAQKLAAQGPKIIIITGISYREGTVGCQIFDRLSHSSEYYETVSYEGSYHGTGDLFASAFCSGLLHGLSSKNAVKVAHDYVHRSIAETIKDGLDGLTYGVEFEKAIPFFVKELESISRKTKEE
ncbi:MAG: pyridoxamine kinase [Bacilli bacterium]